MVLLVHPPNSSSAATLGANPPEAPGTIGLLASEAQPRSLDVEVVAGFAGSAGAGAGSGVAQALPPQTSAPPAQALELREPRVLVVELVVAVVEVVVEGLGWERLNTEVVVVVVVEVAGVRVG